MSELEEAIGVMLKALKLSSKKTVLVRGVSVQFAINDFGLIVCGINRPDYKIIDGMVRKAYKDWRVVYITTYDDMVEKKEEVIWELMKGGYLRWIRLNFPRQFQDFIIMHGFGRKIIEKRLKIWNNKPKYKFLIADNEDAFKNPETYILGTEQSFYDMIPEEE